MEEEKAGLERGGRSCQMSAAAVKSQVSGVWFKVSGLRYQVSGFSNQVSGIGCLVECIRSQVLGIWFHLVLDVKCEEYGIKS